MRTIIWAPGEIGASALRRALETPEIEVVGVKVYSPSKHGVDVGALVGMDEVGVQATTDVDEILELDADVVIHTPKPFAAMQGGDWEVLALLASGKSVVSTLSYFCPGLAGSMSEDRPLSDQLEAVATASGPMPGAVRAAQVAARAALMPARLPVAGALAGAVIDRLGDVADRFELRRPGPQRFADALANGGTRLHGTGLNPGYMAEQMTVALARMAGEVSHVRFVECGDLSEAPEGMWVGLDGIGFGSNPSGIGPTHVFALGSEIYQPEVVANLGHSVFGLRPDEIEQEVDLEGLPARTRVTAGGITIEPGQTAVLHQTHTGSAGGEVFYTNEMCWFVGVENGYYGEHVPFGPPGRGGYTMIIEGDPLTVRAQTAAVSAEPGFAAVTDVSVNMVFDSLGAACAEGEPGVLINDMRPRYRTSGGDGISAEDRWTAGASRTTSVAVLGSGDVARAVGTLAARRPGIQLAGSFATAAEALDSGATVAIAAGAEGAEVERLLAGGIAVVSDGTLPDESDRAASHSTGNHASVVAGRMLNLTARGLAGVDRVRFVDALDLEGADESLVAGFGLGTGEEFDADVLLAAHGPTEVIDAAIAASLGIEEGRLSFSSKVRHRKAGGEVVAVHLTRTGRLGRRIAAVHEVIRYLGDGNAERGKGLPLGGFSEGACVTIEVRGRRGTTGMQIEFSASGPDRADALVTAGALLDAVGPVAEAPPGALSVDHRPRYRIDGRLPAPTV